MDLPLYCCHGRQAGFRVSGEKITPTRVPSEWLEGGGAGLGWAGPGQGPMAWTCRYGPARSRGAVFLGLRTWAGDVRSHGSATPDELLGYWLVGLRRLGGLCVPDAADGREARRQGTKTWIACRLQPLPGCGCSPIVPIAPAGAHRRIFWQGWLTSAAPMAGHPGSLTRLGFRYTHVYGPISWVSA